MNIISLAISVFFSNYLISIIIRYLPVANKRLWSTVVISIYDGGTALGYLLTLLTLGSFNDIRILYALDVIGGIIGIVVAYVASLMMILENVTIFKNRRLREYERNLKNKEGNSIPRQILGLISLIISAVLAVYLVITIVNYGSEILFSLIGAAVVLIVFIILTIYFFVSGKSIHKKITAPALLLKFSLPDFYVVFEADLSKDFTEEAALNGLDKEYLLDEYGLLITSNKKYIVKGITVQSIKREHITNLKMTRIDSNLYADALKEYAKYSRKKIILDENNKIIKISNIK